MSTDNDIALETVGKARSGLLGKWRPLDEVLSPEVFVGVLAGHVEDENGERATVVGNASPELRARMISDGETILELDERGFVSTRSLPDGRFAAVTPQLWGAGLLTISKTEDDPGYGDGYHYEDLKGAVDALRRWEPEQEEEPAGWVRHIPSARRRRYDKDGELLEEYKYPYDSRNYPDQEV